MDSIWAMPSWKWLEVRPITVVTFLLLKASRPL